MGLGDDAIEDGIGNGGFGDVVMPLGHGELADDDGPGAIVVVFQDLE